MKLSEIKELKDFDAHVQAIQEATVTGAEETPAEKEKRIKGLLSDYGEFFAYYLPHYCTDERTGKITKVSWFQKKAADLLLNNRIIEIILNWFRGAAKSTHSNIGYPLWLWVHKELKCMLLVGQTDSKAKLLLSALQAEYAANQRLRSDFGNQLNPGNWGEGEFILKDNTAFFSLGLGMSPRGIRNRQNRMDYIVCDDIDTKEMTKNPSRVREAANWVLEDLMGTYGMWAERFVLANNRIAKICILEELRKKLKECIYLRVIAHDENFKSAWRERFPDEHWRRKYNKSTKRAYHREYLDDPIDEGTIFNENWIHWGKVPPLNEMDALIFYCDPSWKDKKSNDFKAVRFWGRKGKYFYLIRSFVRQTTLKAMVQWWYDRYMELPSDVIAIHKMEASFMQDTILDEFTEEGEARKTQLPIVGDFRKKPDKFQRIESTSPFYERGFIVYNEELKDDPDTLEGIEQLLAFEKGSNAPDDAPDCDEAAIHELNRATRQKDFKPSLGFKIKKFKWF
jgi:phage terminase large subunit-like protein